MAKAEPETRCQLEFQFNFCGVGATMMTYIMIILCSDQLQFLEAIASH